MTAVECLKVKLVHRVMHGPHLNVTQDEANGTLVHAALAVECVCVGVRVYVCACTCV